MGTLTKTRLLVLYNLIFNKNRRGGEAMETVSSPLFHDKADGISMNPCVECGKTVPLYIQIPLCEDCYKDLVQQTK